MPDVVDPLPWNSDRPGLKVVVRPMVGVMAPNCAMGVPDRKSVV